MFRSSLGVVVPPQSLHGHHHGHHHAASMQGATASAAFQYQQHQYQYQPQQHQHALYSHQMNARFNGGSSAPEDDEVFRQLWYEPESEESLSALHMRLSGNGSSSSNMHSHDHLKQEAYGAEDEEEEEPVIEMPPSSTNSLLFEPLDMPKSNTSTGSFSLEQTLKDAFLNFTPEAAMSPLEKMQVSSLSYLRGPSSSSGGSRSNGNSGLYDSFRGQYDQQQHQEYNSSSSNNNISSTSSNSSLLNAILGFQTSSWASNNNNMNDTTTSSNNNNNSNSMSGYQQQSNSMRQLLLSTNPPANMNMNLLESSNNPIWISASMLSTPTSQLPAPELGRKISNKKSKARRPAKASGGRRSAVASALVLSLAGITSTANGSNDDGSSARRSGLSSPSASSVHSDTDTMSTPESGDKNAKGKKCVEPGCVRRAQSNSRCKAHGGGARCQYTGPGGCVRSSQGGGFCRAHGGGKRCEYPGCLRGQQRKGRCYVHGGIRKCQMGDCEKKDRGNGFCISHGGGKRCEHPGCSRAVRRGLLCQLHEIAS